MDNSIRPLGELHHVLPASRERRRQGGDEAEFQRELTNLGEEDSEDLHDTIVIPRPRLLDRPVAPRTEDEAGFRVDVEA